MSHIVRVNAGVKQIALPNGNVYDGQVDITLTDAEFAKIRPALFPGTLTDLGHVADPDVDADFVTTAELATHANDVLLHSSGQEIAYAENITATVQSYSVNGTQDVTGVNITVPASVRPVWLEAEIRVGMTGAPAAGDAATLGVSITDDLGNIVAQGVGTFEGGSSVKGAMTLRARGRVGPLAAQRVYRAQVNRSGGATTYVVFNGALTTAGGGTPVPAFRSWIGAFTQ